MSKFEGKKGKIFKKGFQNPERGWNRPHRETLEVSIPNTPKPFPLKSALLSWFKPLFINFYFSPNPLPGTNLEIFPDLYYCDYSPISLFFALFY
jgi:hypothetical protein